MDFLNYSGPNRLQGSGPMNLKKIVSRYMSFFLLAIVFEARAIWEYSILPDTRILIVGSSIAFFFIILPFPMEAFSMWLVRFAERKEILGSAFIAFLAFLLSVDLWIHHSKIWAALNVLLGFFILFVVWKDRLFPNNEERKLAKRAKIERLFADRAAFEKSWQRRIKISERILLLICALLAVACWMTLFKALAIVPALLGVLFLIGLFARLAPMSDEKFEEELAKAKARYERAEARRARYAVRRAEQAKRLEELKRRQKTSNSATGSLSSFVYWSLMLCVFGFNDRSHLTKPDLVFCAMPAWFLIRALYFFIRQAKTPTGPSAPSASEPSTSTQTI
jgi:hypothetical protein